MLLSFFKTQDRELNDETLLVRQRAVMSLCDYLHDPEHIAEALRVGMFSPFFQFIEYFHLVPSLLFSMFALNYSERLAVTIIIIIIITLSIITTIFNILHHSLPLCHCHYGGGVFFSLTCKDFDHSLFDHSFPTFLLCGD